MTNSESLETHPCQMSSPGSLGPLLRNKVPLQGCAAVCHGLVSRKLGSKEIHSDVRAHREDTERRNVSIWIPMEMGKSQNNQEGKKLRFCDSGTGVS